MLSVIIPCFNNGSLISKLLNCCLQQSYDNWEVIIVDDGSTDDTIEILKSYSSKDKRIKYFLRNRLPKGGDTCRNIGFQNANGEYIIFFDADDLISNTCFENRVKCMEQNPDVDYISFPAKSFQDESVLPDYSTKGKTWGIGKTEDDMKNLLIANYSFAVWCNIYRTESLREKNIKWDENVYVYQDFDFMFSGVVNGLKHKYSNSKEIDYFYRITPNSVSSNFVSEQKCISTIYLFNKVLAKIGNDKRLKKYFKKFIYLHFERLCKEENDKKINDYLEIVKKYYKKVFCNKLQRIYIKYKKLKTIKLKKLYLFISQKNIFTLFFCLVRKIVKL